MTKRDIVVIGASAGGIAPIFEILKGLPKDLKASVFIVVHLSPASPGQLPVKLSKAGPLKVIHPMNREKIEPGKIYFAPANHDLLIENGHLVLKNGPKENRFRPSIDALFRSAALEYGARVIGIILSGYLNDGTAGMCAVKSRGGIAIIQNPEETDYSDMPRNVQEFVKVDYIVSVSEIVPLLVVLTGKVTKEEQEMTNKDALLGINGITLS